MSAQAPQPLPKARRAGQGCNPGIFGHAKPRASYPIYARFLAVLHSEWLGWKAAAFDDALSLLTVLYRHVPSVTSMPGLQTASDSVVLANC